MDAFKNFAYSTVATAPTPATSGLSLTLAAGEGARFPTANFTIAVWAVGAQPLSSNAEIIRVDSRSGDVLTLKKRAAESTVARTVIVGDQVSEVISVKTLGEAGGVRSVTEEMVIPAGFSHVVADDFTIADGSTLGIEDGGVLVIL